jgi:hypothetical protein
MQRASHFTCRAVHSATTRVVVASADCAADAYRVAHCCCEVGGALVPRSNARYLPVLAALLRGSLTETQLRQELGLDQAAPTAPRRASNTIAWWQERQVCGCTPKVPLSCLEQQCIVRQEWGV